MLQPDFTWPYQVADLHAKGLLLRRDAIAATDLHRAALRLPRTGMLDERGKSAQTVGLDHKVDGLCDHLLRMDHSGVDCHHLRVRVADSGAGGATLPRLPMVDEVVAEPAGIVLVAEGGVSKQRDAFPSTSLLPRFSRLVIIHRRIAFQRRVQT
jgi:hypothetical protein